MILVTGCSFTEDSESWGNNLDSAVVNLARGGMGNEYIIGSAIRELSVRTYSAVIVQLSNYWRSELLIGASDPGWIDARKSRARWEMNRLHYGISDSDLVVLRTTDRDHRWWSQKPARRLLDGVERGLTSDHRLIRTYEAVHRLQLYTDSVGIPTRIFWGWRTCRGIPSNPALVDPVANLIDWTRIDDEPMAEWCLANGYTGKLEEDHINKPPKGWTINNGIREMVGHPSPEAQRAYARRIIQPWINNIL